MPALPLLRSRPVVGAALLTLVSGCAVQYAPSDPALGASSGGGAAVFPAQPPAPPRQPVVSAPAVPVPSEPAPTHETGRPGGAFTIVASGGEVIRLAAAPAHGSVAVSGSGGAAPSVRYTPTPGYVGEDQFSLSVAGSRRVITVSITEAR